MIAKKLGIGSLFLAMFLVCMAFVPAVSAETLTEDAADTAVEKLNLQSQNQSRLRCLIQCLNRLIGTYWKQIMKSRKFCSVILKIAMSLMKKRKK